MTACVIDTTRASACRNGEAAAHLKVISIFMIFFTSMFVMSLPMLLARYFQGKVLYDKAIVVIKCFAADGIGRFEGGVGDKLQKGRQAEEMAKLKQRLVSQVLEIGIIFHSMIIRVTMRMSQNVCTIRPLVATLAFHQIFKGMGLGGCIA